MINRRQFLMAAAVVPVAAIAARSLCERPPYTWNLRMRETPCVTGSYSAMRYDVSFVRVGGGEQQLGVDRHITDWSAESLGAQRKEAGAYLRKLVNRSYRIDWHRSPKEFKIPLDATDRYSRYSLLPIEDTYV